MQNHLDYDGRFKKIELDALPVYNDRYIKTKIRTYGDKVYTNFFTFSTKCWCRI